MKKITFLLIFVFTSVIAQSQIFFEYDFKADTVAKQLAGRNGWSASTDAGFPGTGLCAGAICENAKVKLDSLIYKGYGSFAKAIDIVKATPVTDVIQLASEYLVVNTSDRVIRIIQSYTSIVNKLIWDK